MKRLLAVIIMATLAYSGWWFYAAQDLRSSVTDWFDTQRSAGLGAKYADLTVRGFPNRTDLTITKPMIAAGDGTLGWRAPFLQILALSYKRGHVIVAWPDTQTLTTREGDIAVVSDGLRASVIHDDGTLIRSNLESTVLNMTGPNQTLAMAAVNAALEKIDAAPAAYRVAVSVGSLAATPPQAAQNIGPESLGSLRAELELSFDQPLTTEVLSGLPPNVTEMALTRSEIRYGAVTFRVTGNATFDTDGRATGEVTLTAENWRDAIADARESGDLPTALSDGLVELLSMLSTFGGARDALDVTLGLDRGTVLIGPIPVGKLPPLNWR